MRVLRADDPHQAMAALADADDDEIVALLPSSATVLGSDDELAAVLDYFGADLVLAAGGSVSAIGVVSALRSLLASESVLGVVDEDEEVFAIVANAAGELVEIGGRMHSVRTGQPAVIALVEPELGAFEECPSGVDRALFARVADSGRRLASAPSQRVVANEIVQLPFWTAEYCADLVAAAEQFGRWGRDDSDPVPGDELSLMTLSPRLFASVEADIAARIVPQLRTVWPHFASCGLQDAFVIRYGTTAGATAALPLHHDVAQISASVRLNDGYTGGALDFPRQAYDTAGVAVGALTAWPSLVTHPHCALPVTSGVKYNLTLWLRLPG